MELRDYQADAVQAVYRHLRERDDNPVIVIPTGGGKTPVIATICRDAVEQWNGRVLVLAHVKELLEQAADKLRRICPNVKVGVYSAGLGRKDTTQPIIVAGIQSIYGHAFDLEPFDLILIDEAHLIPPDGDGMYQSFIADARKVNPHVRVIGLTATPYRMKSGMICGADNILNHICYEIGVRELIARGYLSKLVSPAVEHKINTTGLHIRAGEFIQAEVDAAVEDDINTEAAVAEIVDRAGERSAVLIFAANVKHGERIVELLKTNHRIECGFITGDTPPGERAELIKRFKCDPNTEDLFECQPLPYLCNVNVLTTGFDAPNVDCVALLRPTASPGLYYQMVGRGFRLCDGKTNCLVLDFGGNIMRHGPVDEIEVKERSPGNSGPAPAKECPECHELISAGYTFCPNCRYEFPQQEKPTHDANASTAGILKGQITDEVREVLKVCYASHVKRDGSGPPSMRVDYQLSLSEIQSEWVCVEHEGYARRKAMQWWTERSGNPIPDNVDDAIGIAVAGGLREPVRITIRHVAGEKFSRIIACEFTDDIPAEVKPCYADDIPF